MKKFLICLIFVIAFASLNAQKALEQNSTKPFTSWYEKCFDEPYNYPVGDIWVTQGTISTYTVTPYIGHTYEFSVPYGNGTLLSTTATTCTILWLTPGGGYAWGYVDLKETNELECIRYFTKNVVITP